jgi:CRISPR-associated protein Cmr6
MADHIVSVSRRPSDADNVGLWLDKLVHRRRRGWTLDRQDRSFSLGQLCRPWQSAAGSDALARLTETVEALHPAPEQRRRLRSKLNGRLLVDHGRAAAAETSVSLHPVWGVPRIPGSALKGVTRAALRADGVPEPDLAGVFGAEKAAGRVLFYDALPVNGSFELALDVLTPHHRDYYEGKGPPADWDSPEPFTFVTVVRTTFDVWLGARSAAWGDVEALAQAAKALQQALTVSGVGGKTAAGYGRFVVERG